MARVTIEDCIDKVPNPFSLVLLAAHRARVLATGEPLKVDRNNDKDPIVALREIAEKKLSTDALREGLILSMQKHAEVDEPEEDELSLLTSEYKLEEEAMTDDELVRASWKRSPEVGDGVF